ncbi:MAG: filamentous hemagglutinin N-terminal domain-containing protein [Rhabdochlamydiaceae bacterium]|nr:filamentous hemagglutinin N-terminal domain-containing protein [Rhabdochlamydiaceae bacterium]
MRINKSLFWAYIIGGIYFTLPPAHLAALPQVEGTASGTANFTTPDSNTLIIEAGDKSIINYHKFNVGKKERVQFVQPSQSATVLNRVKGGDPSSILGKMESNGRVFLINPKGVIFGPGSQVNVGSLVVSTLNIADQDFLNDRYDFILEEGSEKSLILNQGALSAAAGGDIALLGGQVRNEGMISAQAGKVVLASAQKITLDFSGDRLISFALDGNLPSAFISQEGQIEAPEGEVYLKARAAREVIQRTVNTDAFIEGNEIIEEDGVISIVADSRIYAKNIQVDASQIEITSAELLASEDLTINARDSVKLRDALDHPLQTIAYRDFNMFSDSIDIFAFADEYTAMACGRNLKFASENEISADGHFFAGGDLAFLRPSGGNADFRSLVDPVISATGSVTFNAYNGVSLLVQSTGRITATGPITITYKDTAITSGTESETLNTQSSLILRAGLEMLDSSYTGSVLPISSMIAQTAQSAGGSTVNYVGATTGTDITFTGGTITLNSSPGPAGQVIMAAPGGIFFGDNTTINAEGGQVILSDNINGDIPGRTLTINAGTNGSQGTPSINITAHVGNSQPFGALTFNTKGDIAISGNVTLGAPSVWASQAGNISVSGAMNGLLVVPAISFAASTGGSGTMSFNSVGATDPLGTFGLMTENGDILFNGLFTLAGNTTINSSAGTVTFTGSVNGDISGRALTMNTGSGDIIFQSNLGNAQALGTLSLTTTSGNISFNTVSGTTTLGGSTTLVTAEGSVAFNQALNGDIPGRALSISTDTGSIAFNKIGTAGNGIPLGAFSTQSTSGNVTFNQAVILGGPTLLNIGTGSIDFKDALDSDITPRALTISKASGGAGDVTFEGAFGGSSPLGTLTFNTNGSSVFFNNTFNFSSAGAVSTIATNLVSGNGGAVTFASTLGSNVVIGGDLVITTTTGSGFKGGAVTFGNTSGSMYADIPATRMLTVNSGKGDITFNATLGNITTLGAISLNASSGAIAFNQPVTLGGLLTMNTLTGAITFGMNSTLDSDGVPRAVAINKAGMGAVTFNEMVGGENPIGALNFTTGGAAVAFKKSLYLAGNSTINTDGGAVSFGSLQTHTINGDIPGRTLTINAGTGDITFTGAIGNTQPLGALSFTTTTGSVTFEQPVLTGGLTTLNVGTGNILFNNTLDSTLPTSGLTINNAGDGSVVFNGAVGSSGPLGTLAFTTGAVPVTFASTLNFIGDSSIVTNVGATGGAVTFGDAVTMGGALTVTTNGNGSGSGLAGDGSVSFLGDVSGDIPATRNLTVNSGAGSINFSSVGSNASLGGLVLTAGNIGANAGAISFSGPVTLGQSALGTNVISSTTGTITFNSTLDSDGTPRSLAISKTGGGALIFKGNVGAINPIGSLTLNTGTAATTFNGSFTAGGTTSFTTFGGEVTFNGAVNSSTGGNPLSLNTGTGGITFNDSLGNLQPFGSITMITSTGTMKINAKGGSTSLGSDADFISNGGDIIFNGDVNSTVSGITLTAATFNAGKIVFQGVGNLLPLDGLNLTTRSGDITFNEALTLGGTAMISTAAGSITFASTIDSDETSQALNVSKTLSGGSILFSGAIGSKNPLGALTLKSSGSDVTFLSALHFEDSCMISTAAKGTGGNLSFMDAVTIGGNTKIMTSGGAVSFFGPVNADRDGVRILNVDAGKGALRFLAPIGAGQSFSQLVLNSSSTISLDNIGGGTSGSLTSVSIGNNLAPVNIEFNGTTYQGGNQNYTASSSFKFTSTTPIQLITNGSSIEFNGAPIQLNADLIARSFNGNITLTDLANAGSDLRNVIVNAGSGKITLNNVGTDLGQFNLLVLGDPGRTSGDLILQGSIFANSLNGYGDNVILSNSSGKNGISAQTVALSARVNILNLSNPMPITTSVQAYFNALFGTVGTIANGIQIMSSGPTWVGAPVFANFNGTGSFPLANPANIPCQIQFNGMNYLQINPCLKNFSSPLGAQLETEFNQELNPYAMDLFAMSSAETMIELYAAIPLDPSGPSLAVQDYIDRYNELNAAQAGSVMSALPLSSETLAMQSWPDFQQPAGCASCMENSPAAQAAQAYIALYNELNGIDSSSIAMPTLYQEMMALQNDGTMKGTLLTPESFVNEAYTTLYNEINALQAEAITSGVVVTPDALVEQAYANLYSEVNDAQLYAASTDSTAALDLAELIAFTDIYKDAEYIHIAPSKRVGVASSVRFAGQGSSDLDDFIDFSVIKDSICFEHNPSGNGSHDFEAIQFFYLPGIYNFQYDLGSNFFFKADWLDPSYLTTSTYIPPYWMISRS